MTTSYDYIMENWEWLEDTRNFSRYAKPDSGEESETEWLCHDCCTVVEEELYDHECGR